MYMLRSKTQKKSQAYRDANAMESLYHGATAKDGHFFGLRDAEARSEIVSRRRQNVAASAKLGLLRIEAECC